MSVTAKITSLVQNEKEVDVIVDYIDEAGNVVRNLKFSQALSDTIDQDIQGTIAHAALELIPEDSIVKPTYTVATKVNDEFIVDAPITIDTEPAIQAKLG